jgi:hypothetical protein
MPLILLLGAGLALLVLVGCGIGAYFTFFSGRSGGVGGGSGPMPGAGPNLVGTWEMKTGFDTWSWDFEDSGTAKVVAKGPTVRHQGKPGQITTSFRYKLTPGNPPILEIADSQTEGGTGSLTSRTKPGQTKRFEVQTVNDGVMLTSLENGESLILTRK